MDENLNQLARLDSPLGFWVLGSVLAYALTSNALWLAKRRGIELPPTGSWLVEAARFLFYVGVPYLALGGWPRRTFQALLLLPDLGLVGLGGSWPITRWLQATAAALGVLVAVSVLLLLAWTNANRAAPALRLSFPLKPWWATVVGAIYLQVHWAFYRGALAVALDDPYAGLFAGLGLVYLEWALSPAWRTGWRSDREAGEQWLHAALAVVSSLLFLVTLNLWTCLIVHIVLELGFRLLARGEPAHQPIA